MKRLLTPDHHVASLHDVPLQRLWDKGIRCLVLDLDNTLLPWNTRDYPDELFTWLDTAREYGFALFILSNGGGKRVQEAAAALGLDCIGNAGKPRSRGFLEAARRSGHEPAACAAIGDQIFTDVLGANRAGLYSVLVEPLTNNEFCLTRITRLMERLFHRPAHPDTRK